jgi:hypothetical protein
MNHFLVLFVYHCIIGKVCGVPIEMSEDMIRDYIDEAAKDIKPTVRPKLYSVEFVPIEHNGVLKGMRYCCRCLNIVFLGTPNNLSFTCIHVLPLYKNY